MNRILDVLRNIGNQWSELIFVEGVGDGATVLALTDELGHLESGFQGGVALAATHEGNGGEGTGLDTGAQRTVGGVGLDGVVAENGVGVNGGSVPSVAGSRGNNGLLIGQGEGLGRSGDEVGQFVGTGCGGFLVLDGLVAGVIVDTSELLDLEGGHPILSLPYGVEFIHLGDSVCCHGGDKQKSDITSG